MIKSFWYKFTRDENKRDILGSDVTLAKNPANSKSQTFCDLELEGFFSKVTSLGYTYAYPFPDSGD